MYIGVTAVDGLKLWGVGGKKVAGLGGLGEWVGGGRSDGRRREVAGRACPAPTGGERKIVGRPALRPPRACMGVGMVSGHPCRGRRPRRPAEGSRPLPTMRKISGWLREACGPGMPGPYGMVDGWRVLAGRCGRHIGRSLRADVLYYPHSGQTSFYIQRGAACASFFFCGVVL